MSRKEYIAHLIDLENREVMRVAVPEPMAAAAAVAANGRSQRRRFQCVPTRSPNTSEFEVGPTRGPL